MMNMKKQVMVYIFVNFIFIVYISLTRLMKKYLKTIFFLPEETNIEMEFILHKKDYYMNKLDYSKVTE